MKLTKKLFISSTMFLSLSPAFFVLSCSSSEQTNGRIEQTDQLFKFFDANPDALSPKIEKPTLKNFVEIASWKNQEDFIAKLEQYFIVSQTFKDKINENGIYSKIKKIVIQPKPNSSELTIIFYLNSSTNDNNIVSKTIKDALASAFSYPNQIIIPTKITTEKYANQDELNKAWNAISKKEKGYQEVLKTMLIKAFNISLSDVAKIVENYEKYFSLTLNSSNQIFLQINKDGVAEGFVFYQQIPNVEPFKIAIGSEPLFVKE